MESLCLFEKKRRMDFAFVRFSGKKYPVCVERRMFMPDHNGGYHNHDFPQLWYCMSGHYFHKVGDQIYECTKGSVIMIPPGVFHKFRVPDGECAELLFMNLMYDIFMDTDIQQYVNAVSVLFLPPFSQKLGYTFPTYRMLGKESKAALEEYTSWLALLDFQKPGSVENEDILEKLEQIFSLPEFALPQVYRKRVVQLIPVCLYPILRALSYLNNHYAEKIAETELLRKAGIGHSCFHQSFTRYTGYIYSEYRQMLRVRHVHIYLSHTLYPLSYISDMCGFCNTQYMAKIYKKYMGKSPRESRLYLYDKYHKKGK